MVRFDIVQIKKSGEGYLVDNYLFRKDRVRGEKVYLKCLETKREFCPARAVVENADVIITNADHNHAVPDIKDYDLRTSLRNATKSMANANLSTPRIFQNCRNDILGTAVDNEEREDLINPLPTFRQVRGLMQHSRSEMLPPSPDNRSGIDFNLFDNQIRNQDGTSFLLADSRAQDINRILIFGDTRNLTLLAQASGWYIDGTFWSVPHLYSQLFTIHAFVLGQQFPLIYALLPNKSRETYERIFQLIMQEMTNRNLNLNGIALQKIVSDFEIGIITAVRNLYPNVVHQGCYFHYAQAIYRKLAEIANSVRYRTDPEFRCRCRMLIALGLVPTNCKQQFLQALQQTYANDADFSAFRLRYFIPTWFNHYNLAMWDWFQVQHRTNNNVEGWHSRFNKALKQPHLSIYKFILMLKQEHENIQILITERQNGEPLPRENNEYARLNRILMRIQGEFQQRQVNPIENYLRPLANCAPNPTGVRGLA